MKVIFWRGFIIILNFCFILVLSDIWFYRSNGSFISPYLIELAGNVPMLGPAITSMMKLGDVFLVVDLIVIFIKITRDRKIEAKRNIRIFVMLILGFGLYLFWTYIKAGICDDDLSKNFIFPKSLKTEQAIGYLNPIGYHIIGLYTYVKDTKPYVFSTEENESISSWLKNKEENLPDNQYYNSMKGKNIIIIQWESLENFVIGKTVNGQEIMPSLNRIMKNSYYFDNFYEQTWNASTSDAELITNTSSLPTREGGGSF